MSKKVDQTTGCNHQWSSRLESEDFRNWYGSDDVSAPLLGSLTFDGGARKGKANLFSTTINLVNNIAGAGMLSLPYAFANSGVWIGILWFFLVGIGEVWSILLLSRCVLSQHNYSFSALAKKACKFRGKECFVNGILALNCFGYATSYLIVLGQLLPEIVDFFLGDSAAYILKLESFWRTLLCWGICFPLACQRSLEALKYTSFLGCACVLYVMVITAMYGFGNGIIGDPCEEYSDAECPGSFYMGFPGDIPNLLRVISIYCFAFAATQNIPTFALELKERSVPRLALCVWIAFFSAIAVYIVIALSGYKAFGSAVNADLLVSFPRNTWTTVARIGVSLTLISVYPLQMHPTKRAVCKILFKKDVTECSNWRYYNVVIVLVALSWGIALSIEDLSVVLTFIGGSVSMLLSFTFPAYFYMRIFRHDGCSGEMVISYVIFSVSLILIPVLISVEIYSLL